MIKEEKNIDFYTTGRQPSEEDFARIGEWIKVRKQRQSKHVKKEKTSIRKSKATTSK